MTVWSVERLMEVLSGDYRALWKAFLWDSTPQGRYHWYDRAEGVTPLTGDDYAYLRKLYADAVKHRLGVGS